METITHTIDYVIFKEVDEQVKSRKDYYIRTSNNISEGHYWTIGYKLKKNIIPLIKIPLFKQFDLENEYQEELLKIQI